jgi:heme-degrading monooxygenase HmoA
MGDQFVAAYWKVRAGSEDEFMKRWRDFTSWSIQNAPGAKSFTLLHNMVDPQYFISFGTWSDRESIHAWWEMPGFGERYEQVASLCEEHVGAEHSVEALLTPVA